MLNLLVVMIDCLRQDRIEGGRKTAITPNIDSFRERGIVFDNVHAVGSNTTSVMGSWFTGLYPFRHGLRSFRDRDFLGRPTTMAEELLARGYRTVTTVTEAMADARDLLNGFQDIEKRDKKREAIHNGYGDRCREKLKELNRSEDPWFYFIHTCELHPDRQCAPEFRRRRYGKSYYDRCLSSLDYYLEPIFDEIDWTDTAVVVFGDHGDNLLWEPAGEFASKLMNRLRGDNRISALASLRDIFFKIGLYSNWKSILRSNPIFHHDYHLYRFLTRSPLMFTAPGLEGGHRSAALMSSVDMLPTLLEYLGFDAPASIDGCSFAPMVKGEPMMMPRRALYQEVVTDFVMKGRDPTQLRVPLLQAIIEDDWKYVESTFDARIKPELYNLREDPQETQNCYVDSRKCGFMRNMETHLHKMVPAINVSLGSSHASAQ